MKRINRNSVLRNMTIGEKLLAFFVMLVVVPLFIFALLFSQMVSQTTTDQIENSSKQFVEQAVVNIEKELEEIDSMMLSFQWDNDIQKMLRKDYSENTLRERKLDLISVTDKMQILTNTRLGIELLYLSRTDNEEYSIAVSAQAEELLEGFWYKREKISEYAKETDGRINWLKLGYDDSLILGVRDVYDVELLSKTGLIVMGIHEGQILKLYSNLKTTSGSFFCVFDENGNVVSTDSPDNAELSEIYQSIRAGGDWAALVSGYNLTVKQSAYTGWFVVQATPNKEIMSSVNKTKFIIFGIILISLAILLFILRVFTNTMVGPIRQLMGEMEKVKREDFDVHADDSRGDEFGDLATDFNLMVEKIQRLIEEDLKKRLVLQEAEYKYLRAQINPHFIYNTLDSINWMAMETGHKDISKISVALGRLLRRSISGKEDAIFLGDELEGIRDYITIQKMRYGERLKFSINVAQEYLDCVIPRSALQPIVENALVHGIDKKAGSGVIEVSAVADRSTLMVLVKDDGIGMSKERIKQAMEGSIEEEDGAHTGVGFKNVHKRLELLFGKGYGIEIESEPGRGTVITVRIPLRLELDFKGRGTKNV
jgi:two-component system, sensor histidine kinase YesM